MQQSPHAQDLNELQPVPALLSCGRLLTLAMDPSTCSSCVRGRYWITVISQIDIVWREAQIADLIVVQAGRDAVFSHGADPWEWQERLAGVAWPRLRQAFGMQVG